MASQQVHLHFPPGPATDPVIYQIVSKFDVVPNIRRASIQDHSGWMVLEISGEQPALDAALAYLREIGVEVTSPDGDIVAG